MNMRDDKDYRRLICVSLAGQAIARAAGDDFMLRVEVAALEDGLMIPLEADDAEGIVFARWDSALNIGPWRFMEWDQEAGDYLPDRAGFEAFVDQAESLVKGYRRQLMRHLRHTLCALLAGPIAEAIHLGVPADEFLAEPHHKDAPTNVARALGITRFMPDRNEYRNAVHQTERLLRHPEIWRMLMRLVDELEEHGQLSDRLPAFLPAVIPNWPPSPRATRECPLIVRPYSPDPA